MALINHKRQNHTNHETYEPIVEHLDNSLQMEPSRTQVKYVKQITSISLTRIRHPVEILPQGEQTQKVNKYFAKQYWLDKRLLYIKINYQGPLLQKTCHKENLNSTKIKHHKLSSQAKLDEPKSKPK